MATNPQHLYTLEEYFALEHAGDARYEYWDGEIICMSGGSRRHSRIGGRVYQLLANQLEQHRTCEAFTADQAVKNPSPSPPYFYPDVTVACGEAEFTDVRGIDVLTNPTLLVEVMSPTSRQRDQKHKLELYRKISSLQEYLIIDQDQPVVIQHSKQLDGTWLTNTFKDLSALVILSAIGYQLTLTEIYATVTFDNLESEPGS
jgi:Uma2 family endonuclease